MFKQTLFRTLFIVLFFSTFSFAGTIVGESIDLDIETPHPYPAYWSHTVEQGGAGWVKLHFSDFKLNDEDLVVLRNIYGNEVERFTGADIMNIEQSRFKVIPGENGTVSFWAPRIDGPGVTVELFRMSGRKKGRGFDIRRAGIGYALPESDHIEDDVARVESICGADDKTSIACAPSWCQNAGRSVGRIIYLEDNDQNWHACSGFLVSSCSSHFITVEHDISTQAEVASMDVRFNYRLDVCGGSLATYTTYFGNQWIKDDPNNDYCLLTLTGSPQNTFGYLRLLSREPIADELIYIPQHPLGQMQQISFGSITDPNLRLALDFGHMADTEACTSGSPVMTDQFDYDQVIGLQHMGGCPNSAVEINQIRAAILTYICQ